MTALDLAGIKYPFSDPPATRRNKDEPSVQLFPPNGGTAKVRIVSKEAVDLEHVREFLPLRYVRSHTRLLLGER